MTLVDLLGAHARKLRTSAVASHRQKNASRGLAWKSRPPAALTVFSFFGGDDLATS